MDERMKEIYVSAFERTVEEGLQTDAMQKIVEELQESLQNPVKTQELVTDFFETLVEDKNNLDIDTIDNMSAFTITQGGKSVTSSYFSQEVIVIAIYLYYTYTVSFGKSDEFSLSAMFLQEKLLQEYIQEDYSKNTSLLGNALFVKYLLEKVSIYYPFGRKK